MLETETAFENEMFWKLPSKKNIWNMRMRFYCNDIQIAGEEVPEPSWVTKASKQSGVSYKLYKCNKEINHADPVTKVRKAPHIVAYVIGIVLPGDLFAIDRRYLKNHRVYNVCG